MIDQSDLEDIRELGEEAMVTEFTITRAVPIVPDPSQPGYNASTDYGDDELGTFTPVDGPIQPVGVTAGWFVSRLAPALNTEGQSLSSIQHLEIRMPWGTDVKPQDVLVSSDTGDEYIVVDTNADNAWAEWLVASVTLEQ